MRYEQVVDVVVREGENSSCKRQKGAADVGAGVQHSKLTGTARLALVRISHIRMLLSSRMSAEACIIIDILFLSSRTE
jgi:hypothetical protein